MSVLIFLKKSNGSNTFDSKEIVGQIDELIDS